jgi:phosphatidyl-myo-inositol alpha-mannosyltransferase
MKVALVSPYDLSTPGGAQSQVLGHAEALVQRGHEVLVVAPGRATSWSVAGAESVAVGRSLSLPANGSLAPVAPLPRAMRRSARALAAFAPDVIHLHEPLAPGPSLAALVTSAAPLVATFHRARPSRVYAAYARPLRRFVDRIGVKVAVSDTAAATLREVLGPAEITVVPNAVAVERFAHLHPDRSVAPTALFVGRVEPRKGLDVLLEAFHGLAGDFALRVVGDGRELKRLQRRFGADDRIVFLGRLGNDGRDCELAAADVFVSPALGGESFGVVLLEAMAARCAVLASDLPGYRDAASEAAWFFPAGNVKALRDKLRLLLCEPAARAELSSAGSERASLFSFNEMAARYLQLYGDAIEQEAPRAARGRRLLGGSERHRTLVT